MIVLEQVLRSKTGDDGGGEDRLLVTDSFAAVIDGATAKEAGSGGPSPGALAADAVLEAVTRLDAGCDRTTAIRSLDAAVAAIQDQAVERPTAVCALYSAARREVWRVGDVGVRIGQRAFPARKHVDDVAAAFRSALLQAELLNGADRDDLAAHDPGRAAILGLLRQQGAFANRAEAGAYCYAVLDGTGRAAEFAETFQAEPGDEVVLATDGYLSPAATLAAAETELKDSLAEDPLRIRNHAATKGVRPGSTSFDDRAYLRLRS
ncbi:MAG: hypothetical protein NXI12_09500 [Alphaproteobacteria bacterium]|nr:hypothetical protein [Alphaproteobacteria bacterium]